MDLKKIKLGKHFNAYEFCNKEADNAIEVPNIELFQKLDQLREIVGRIDITSGYRTKDFNTQVRGSKNSNHLKGLAADVKFDFSYWNLDQLKMILSGLGFVNIGFYLNNMDFIQFIHLDIGERWNNVNGWDHYNGSAFKLEPLCQLIK